MSSTEEQEPLLGVPGAAQQGEGEAIWHNLFIGTGIVAQFGAWILLAVVWSGVFSHPWIFFHYHPLFNSAAVVLAIQAILILQPTHTSEQKRTGTLIHAALVDVTAALFLAALIIIEISKRSHPGTHLKSVHAIMGLVTYILVLIQAIVGATQYFFPNLYGSEENAKKIYKYHRASGYVIVVLLGATVAAATWTDYNLAVLQIHHWSVITAVVILAVGLGARIKKQKFGF